uniref:F-box domain-containing protein n=1 Tax=Glossina palpalis gambiensis TaxID=67801 RepID=A0A1B0BWZ8_9MUSC
MSSSKSSVALKATAEITTILDLNDDCLLNIFKYLSIQDAFNILGCFDSRIDDVALTRIADLKNLCFSLREAPIFKRWQLQIIGQNLESICISAGYTLSSQMSLNYLQILLSSTNSKPRLHELTINYVKFNDDYLDCVLNVVSNIKYLDLSFCQLNDELLLPILERAEKLQILKLIANYNLECKSLHHIQSPHLNFVELEMNLRCGIEVNKFIAEHVNLESESITDVCTGEDPPEDGNHSSSVVISETDDCDSVSSNNSSAADFKMSSTICISRANSSSLKAAEHTFKGKLFSAADAFGTGAADAGEWCWTGEAKLCGGELGGVSCVKIETSGVLIGRLKLVALTDFIQKKDSRLLVRDLYKYYFVMHNCTNLCKLNERVVSQQSKLVNRKEQKGLSNKSQVPQYSSSELKNDNMADTTNAAEGLLLLQI